MAQPTALIAEDEAVLRAELRAHLGALWPELRIVGEAANGFEALQLLDRLTPDLVFLDIQMPGLTGLEVARQTANRCHVVFVTAFDAHAVAAFEQGAVVDEPRRVDPHREAEDVAVERKQVVDVATPDRRAAERCDHRTSPSGVESWAG